MEKESGFSLQRLSTYSDSEISRYYAAEVHRYNELMPVRRHFMSLWKKALADGDMHESEDMKLRFELAGKMMDASREIFSACEVEHELRKRR